MNLQFKIMSLSILVLSLSACSTLPPVSDKPISYAFSDTSQTKLGKKATSVLSRKTQSKNESDLVSFIFENSNVFENRLAIDEMEVNGKISSKTARMARRVITSQKNIDAVTSNPVKEEIIASMYDLNATSDTPPEKYLTGISNLRARVLEEHDKGLLSASDVKVINQQITSATSKKLSDATAAYSSGIADVKNRFENSLPPEKVLMAARLYFDKTVDKDLSKEKSLELADKVIHEVRGHIDNEKVKAREATLLAVEKPSDDVFLKSIGRDTDFVNSLAKKYNKTYEEVLSALRKRANR